MEDNFEEEENRWENPREELFKKQRVVFVVLNVVELCFQLLAIVFYVLCLTKLDFTDKERLSVLDSFAIFILGVVLVLVCIILSYFAMKRMKKTLLYTVTFQTFFQLFSSTHFLRKKKKSILLRLVLLPLMVASLVLIAKLVPNLENARLVGATSLVVGIVITIQIVNTLLLCLWKNTFANTLSNSNTSHFSQIN